MDGNQLRKARKRQAILKAANQLFIKKGYQETSVAEIAKAAGASQVTVYKYFSSKLQLGRAVTIEMIEDGYQYYGAMLADPQLDFMAKMKKMMVEAAQEANTLSPSFYRLLVAEMRGDNGDHSVQRSYDRQKATFWHRLFDQGRAEGKIDEAISDRALMTYVDMYVTYVQRLNGKSENSAALDALHADGEQIIQLFFYGLIGDAI